MAGKEGINVPLFDGPRAGKLLGQVRGFGKSKTFRTTGTFERGYHPMVTIIAVVVSIGTRMLVPEAFLLVLGTILAFKNRFRITVTGGFFYIPFLVVAVKPFLIFLFKLAVNVPIPAS